MTRVPVIQQLNGVECGPTCLAMVLSGLGRATRVNELREVFGTGRDGTTGREILQAARSQGLTARGVRVDADGLRTVQLPAIAHWDGDHYNVVERVTSKHVRIIDPARGRRREPIADFLEHSQGVLLEFEVTPAFEPRRRRLSDSTSLRFVRDLVRMAPWLIVLTLVLSGIVQLIGLSAAWANQYAIDSAIGTGTGTLGVLALGVLGYVAVHTLTNLGRGLTLLLLQQRLDSFLNTRFMSHLLRLPFSFFQTRSTGDLLARLSSNVMVRDMLTSQMLSLVVDSLFVVVYTILLLLVSPLYAAVVAVLAVIQAIVVAATLRPVRELAQRELAGQAESQSVAVDSLQGMEYLKSSGLSGAALGRWTRLYDTYLQAAFRRRRFDTVNESVVGLFQAAAPLLLLLLGTWQVLSGQLTVGGMVALSAVASSLLRPVTQLMSSLRYLQSIGSYLDRIFDVLDTPAERAAPGSVPPGDLQGRIELRSVGFRYAAGAPSVLRDTSLTVEPGSKVAVVGTTGSGKTTLVRILTGLLTPTDGEVLVDGRPVDEFEPEQLRRRFGLVTQDPHVFGASIRANLQLGRTEPASDDELLAALDGAQFRADLSRMPMGLDTIVAEGGSALSGGQRQRLALARALLAQPSVLILDEATSHLDAITEAAIAETLSGLGCTRIVIAHRISTVMDADRIVVLHEGSIVEQGTHDDLVAAGGRYAQLVRRQVPATMLTKSEPPALT